MHSSCNYRIVNKHKSHIKCTVQIRCPFNIRFDSVKFYVIMLIPMLFSVTLVMTLSWVYLVNDNPVLYDYR